MRGQENPQASMFSYVSLEQRVPKDHPLRTLRALVDGILANMSALFDQRYSHTGRPSIPPEQLLRALLVQILFTIRSERQLVEQLDYNLLFRWFVGLGMDDAVWDRTVFSINRDRLLDTDVARQFFRRVLHLAEWQGFVSDEHFSVDGTMIHTPEHHRPAGAAVQEGRVRGSEAALQDARAVGEPKRARRRCGEHAGYGARGVGSLDPDDRSQRAQTGRDSGGGQRL